MKRNVELDVSFSVLECTDQQFNLLLDEFFSGVLSFRHHDRTVFDEMHVWNLFFLLVFEISWINGRADCSEYEVSNYWRRQRQMSNEMRRKPRAGTYKGEQRNLFSDQIRVAGASEVDRVTRGIQATQNTTTYPQSTRGFRHRSPSEEKTWLVVARGLTWQRE